MSTSLSGIDVVLEAPRRSFEPRVLLYVLHQHWPEGVFQEGDDERTRPLKSVMEAGRPLRLSEFFVYNNNVSAESWNREGLTRENVNGMVHFVIRDDATRPDNLQVTMVVGAMTHEMLRLCSSLSTLFKLAMVNETPPSRISGRSSIEAELRLAGSSLTRKQFYNVVDEVRKTLYPKWTRDELACHPHEAQQFCEVVGLKTEAPLPDNLIMKAMLTVRKRKHRSS